MDGINAQNNLLTGSFYLYTNVGKRGPCRRVPRGDVAGGCRIRQRIGPGPDGYARGSNKFNGSAFYEVRNSAFNANDFINNALGKDAAGHEIAKRDQLKQNNYGVRFGGPVKRNKTFFNGIWEPYKQRNNAVFTATVYTTARARAFSASSRASRTPTHRDGTHGGRKW